MAIETSYTQLRTDPFVNGHHVLGREVPGSGSAIANSDAVAGAGFGTTAAVAVAAGSSGVACETRATVTVTAGGTGEAQATATVVVTFKGAYSSAPKVFLQDTGTNAGYWRVSAVAVGSFTAIMDHLPVAAQVYGFEFIVLPA